MRLLIVSQDFPPRIGGIENYTRQIALRLAEPEDTTVVAPLVKGSSAMDRHLSFRVVRVPVPPNILPFALRPVLRHLLSRGRFDATLHAQWQTAGAALKARSDGLVRRVFVATHGRELLLSPNLALPWLTGMYERRRHDNLADADLVFAVSRYTRDLARQKGARSESTLVIPNGVDPAPLVAAATGRVWKSLHTNRGPVVLTVCRLVPRKGIDLVLRSLPEVLQVYPDLTYIVVGDGPDRNKLQALAEQLGLARSVRWEGRIPHEEIGHYFAACDLFVLTPRNLEPDVEGFGLVFLEAAAAGKPVVASDAGGIPDAVIDGETGLLIPEGQGHRLTEAMLSLLSNPELGNRLAENGRKRVLSRMTWDAIADRMRDAMAASLAGPLPR